MSGWFEPFAELVMEGIFAVLSLVIDNRIEKSDLQKLMTRQREEHAAIIRQMATSGKKRSLRGYDLTGTRLADIELVDADLMEISFRDAQLSRVNFQEANLTGADFSGAFLVDVNLSKTNLQAANFTDASLCNVDFSQANLRDAQLLQVNEITKCIWRGVCINTHTKLKREINTQITDSF